VNKYDTLTAIHTSMKEKDTQKVRINKYLAEKQYASRRGADELIKQKRVLINGTVAVLGDTVGPDDTVEVKKSILDKEPIYIAYNKPVGVLTHSAGEHEVDIQEAIIPLLKGSLHNAKLFPIGRLDKDSHGLIILTNDGRITKKLLDPEEHHEKEYVVETANRLPNNFAELMSRGVQISDEGVPYKTKPCVVRIINERKFNIILTEGKKRQIRRMCEACGAQVKDLMRVRIMNIKLGYLSDNNVRKIKGEELETFLSTLGIQKRLISN
jgi:23S rRNA pseudouridine2604 synthase